MNASAGGSGPRGSVTSDEKGGFGVSDETTKTNWKVDFNDLEIGEQLGQGSIGKVFKGKWRGLTVAIKEIHHTANEDQIQEELSLLIKVRHPNLTLFMGIACPTSEKLCIISEHMSRGNLYSVLHDKNLKLDWKRRIMMALDTARALNYLHCSKPPILHKNLNSINILVDKELVTKVSDYGLEKLRIAAKKSGVYTQPLWVAPEIFKKNKFTKSTDVYSFGIILWEILTRKTPYQGKIKANNNIKAIQEISSGMRPEIPMKTPPRYADLMARCWHADSSRRPTFQMIVDELVEMEKEKVDITAFEEIEIKVQTAASIDHRTPGSLVDTKDRKPWMVSYDEIKLEEIIGNGSFGEVWSGSFRGKKVAVKKCTALSKNHVADFLKELNLMCSLRHPNCVLFMGACVDENNLCIIMEYCGKGNLFSILHDVSQPIDYNQIIKILTEAAQGILYLHLNNPPILHRDLKSLNILVDDEWNIKISDYGLSDLKPELISNDTGGSGGSGTSGVNNLQLGSIFWLAPECMEASSFTEQADVYAYGIIIWELFTREIPFSHLSPHQAALAVLAEDKRPEIPAFVPPNFASLIRACWDRDPKKRPSFPQILEALAQLKKEGLPRIDLSLENARLYRKKTTVFAFRSKDTVVVYKPWGTGEGKKGDWVLVGPGDDVYTCDAAIFAKTYKLVDLSQPHLYRKTGAIFALEMKRDFLMATLEGMEHGSAGDWIAQNPVDGEQWPIAAKTFKAMYEIAPEQTLDDGEEGINAVPVATVGGAGRKGGGTERKHQALQEETLEKKDNESEALLRERVKKR